ncbi:Rieske 2Fe-2S domain-containing protein [Bradyrhizobium sp. USDA 10063]
MGTGWYPVALAEGLERGTSTGTRLLGRELVVWRDSADTSHVWEDRCPHRGMRLSFGFVRDNHIACLYHGWQYDISAQCRYIPAHPDLAVPGTIRVATYPSIERLGIVWAWNELDSSAPEEIAFAERGPVTPVRSLYVDASAAKVFDALVLAECPLLKNTGGATQRSRTDALVSLKNGGDEILVAVQPLSDVETALHIVIAGSPDVYRGDSQKCVSAWGEALRREVEGTPRHAGELRYGVAP